VTTPEAPVFSSRDVEIRSCPGGSDRREKTIFVLGGRAPAPEWLGDLASRNPGGIWAVDSGVRPCRAAGLVPSILIGDRDSADVGDWGWAVSRGAREKLYEKDKDETDFQLAISLFAGNIGNGARNALIVTGCFGGAMDHLMSNFHTLASGCGDFPRCMVDEAEGAFFLFPGDEATIGFSRTPEAVSLLPATDVCTGVGISGVKWPLEGAALEISHLWAISNETIFGGDAPLPVKARCGEGILAVYWRFPQAGS
jgi:thiamine pyrophosphokinase